MLAAIDLDAFLLGATVSGDAPLDVAGRARDAAPSVSRELQVEAVRLLRARRDRLAGADTSIRDDRPGEDLVAAIVRQLAPIQSRTALLDSFAREAVRSDEVRRAYAIRWLDLARAVPAATVRRGRASRVVGPGLRRRP